MRARADGIQKSAQEWKNTVHFTQNVLQSIELSFVFVFG